MSEEGIRNFYIPSFSHRSIVYKGPAALAVAEQFYRDLAAARLRDEPLCFSSALQHQHFPDLVAQPPFSHGWRTTARSTPFAAIAPGCMRAKRSCRPISGEEISDYFDRSFNRAARIPPSLDNALEALVMSGRAVVTDFGIAKAAEGPSHTHTGFMVGTPAYMSPEQCSGGEVSGASDQYSLGAVAYEMITGVPPFSGSTYSVIQAHVERPPPPIREHAADCPADLEEAIHRMLAKDPNDRWPGMTQALTALSAAPLMEDDPLRAELSRLATAGRGNGFIGLPTPLSQPPRTNAVLHVTPPGMMRAITILPPPPADRSGRQLPAGRPGARE